MNAQWQNGNCAVPGTPTVPQIWSGVNPPDHHHKAQQASSEGHGQEAKQEWISCFDDFCSDMFLHDFENVDMAKYNVVCTLGMRGGWYSLPNNPSCTTSVYSSVTIPSIYSSWNNQLTSSTNFTTDNAGCVASADAYPQWGLGQTMTREHFQSGTHTQGYLQTTIGEHPQGHLQSVGEEHQQGHLQTIIREHPQGHLQSVGGEYQHGYLQTIIEEHHQGHLESVGRENPHDYLQATDREHQQGRMQPLDEEHTQVQLQPQQQLLVGACPQQAEEDTCVFTRVRKRNLGNQNLRKEDLTFLPKSLSTSPNSSSTKACSGNPDVGLTLPSISIIFNNINEMGESTEACQLQSAETDESVGHVTSSEDRWQTTVSTYGSLSSVKSSPTLGPTSSDHVSSSSDSEDSRKNVRVREVRRAADEPRRPKNGFIRFSIEHRQQIAVKHPRLDNREISRILGCKWRKLSNEEKKPYEEEFEKDIQAIREVNPEWRYAPARQLVEELIEPMPSRLRPRNSLKRKKLPSLVRTYSRRQNKSSKNSKKPCTTVNTEMLEPPTTPLSREDTSTTWVQCDLCGKWRCLPSFIPPEKLCDIWFCYFNPDKRYNSCSIKEELDPEDSADPPHLPVPPKSSCTDYIDSGAHVVSR